MTAGRFALALLGAAACAPAPATQPAAPPTPAPAPAPPSERFADAESSHDDAGSPDREMPLIVTRQASAPPPNPQTLPPPTPIPPNPEIPAPWNPDVSMGCEPRMAAHYFDKTTIVTDAYAVVVCPTHEAFKNPPSSKPLGAPVVRFRSDQAVLDAVCEDVYGMTPSQAPGVYTRSGAPVDFATHDVLALEVDVLRVPLLHDRSGELWLRIGSTCTGVPPPRGSRHLYVLPRGRTVRVQRCGETCTGPPRP